VKKLLQTGGNAPAIGPQDGGSLLASGRVTARQPAGLGLLMRLGPAFLPFADAATPELPLSRLLRLSLFQVTVGMALVLVNGTLNRVMILDLDVPAWLVAAMIALPLVFAPLRPFLGFKSDNHRSLLGWRRVPYIWLGTLMQFAGLAIMPFALILLSGDTQGPAWVGNAGAALAFLLVGAGLHTTQTAGLALATDLATPQTRARVVAFLYVMLLAGMSVSALALGQLLADFSHVRLIQTIQGTAIATVVLNIIALWKQEPRYRGASIASEPAPDFGKAWRAFLAGGRWVRIFVALGLGTVGFSMQDILLEPFGGQVLHMTVAETTKLTALFAFGALSALFIAARKLRLAPDPYRFAAMGVIMGLGALSAFVFSAPLQQAALFESGVFVLGFGSALFAAGTLTAAMDLAKEGQAGLALGAWGAVGASATGGGIALGGALRDVVASLASDGALGPALLGPEIGYLTVYHLEIFLLFATLAAIGPLVRTAGKRPGSARTRSSLAETPA